MVWMDYFNMNDDGIRGPTAWYNYYWDKVVIVYLRTWPWGLTIATWGLTLRTDNCYLRTDPENWKLLPEDWPWELIRSCYLRTDPENWSCYLRTDPKNWSCYMRTEDCYLRTENGYLRTEDCYLTPDLEDWPSGPPYLKVESLSTVWVQICYQH